MTTLDPALRPEWAMAFDALELRPGNSSVSPRRAPLTWRACGATDRALSARQTRAPLGLLVTQRRVGGAEVRVRIDPRQLCAFDQART